MLKEALRLSNPPESELLGNAVAKYLHATIFLGKHFDEATVKPSAVFSDFLTLLRFSVLTAEPYRALPIPQKVKALIDRQDIYLGLVIGTREHDWIIAEASYALGRDKQIVLLVEDGSRFNPTLQGKDFETIPFPKDSIEKSFLKLLQGFRSMNITGI
jgi:hypothetical protein